MRFLLRGARAELLAEGPGWQHHSAHPTLADAVRFLATLPDVDAALYAEALGDLEGRLALEQEYGRHHAA